MKTSWRTLWQHHEIVVYRDEVEVDRLAAERIERVYLVYRGRGDTPNDIAQTIVELAGAGGFALFEAETGFAGRVNFERQSFWQERRCIYWVPAAAALLPWRLRLGGWPGDANKRAFRRLAKDDLADCVERWQLEGPQTWEDRKRRRIERTRPFGHASGVHA